MDPEALPHGDHSSSGLLEDLVARALEVLDQGGEAELARFLDGHPEHRTQVAELVQRFRGTGLLARDARSDFPERLGEFRLLQRLGGGGMGVVFLAEQESLRRTVALKIVRPDLLFFAGTRERFQREIDVIARLAHPAIVPIVATGEHDGMPWYAMQRIEGCSADEAVRRLHGREPAQLRGLDLCRVLHGSDEIGSQPDRSQFAGDYWEVCVRLVRQAALGLEHAHRQGVVHRDVKPSNIMLTPDGRALLLDFGLARVHGDPKLTRTGGEPGSPAYMAPEQLRGQTADERADVYSLAATLFQLLELRAPFVAADGEALRAAILRGGATLRAAIVPRELRSSLAVAMDLDRDRRYASAAEFAEDLDAVLARRPIRARPLPFPVRAQRWLQRHRTVSALLLAAALLAVVLPGVLAWQQAQSMAALAAEQQRALRSRDEAIGAVQEFLTTFASGELLGRPGGREANTRLLGRADEQVASIADDLDPARRRIHLTFLGRWQISALRVNGQAEQAHDKAREVLALWPDQEEVTPRVAYHLAAVRTELVVLAALGMAVPDVDEQVAQAKRDLDAAMAEPALHDIVHEVRQRLEIEQATLLEGRGDREAAVAALRHTLDWVNALTSSTRDLDLTRATLRNRLGEVLFGLGRLDEAQRCFDEVLRDYEPADDPALGGNDGLYLRVFAQWGLARITMQHERWEEAVRQYRAAMRLAEHRLYCFGDDRAVIAAFAKISTETAQVERRCGTDAATVTAMLERAHALFRQLRGSFAVDRRTRDSCRVNLEVLTEQHWAARDGQRLATVAREMVELGATDARCQSLAAMRLGQAAQFLAASGDEDEAARCDDEAMAALLACEADGWFAPTRLDIPPFSRIASRDEFAALAARHPR